MEKFHVINQVDNLEIISKLMNSVARQCDCRVKYCPEDRSIKFYGDKACQRYIVEETLSFFRAA